jgi:hypothetical protein
MTTGHEEPQTFSLDPYERWPDSVLEVWRDSHPDPVQRLLVSQAWSRRMVERAFRMLEMQDAPDIVIQVLHDRHQKPDVQARAAEELSRRAAQKSRAVTQNARNAEEAAALMRADESAVLDEAAAQAQAEFGPAITRVLNSRWRRQQLTMFKDRTQTRAEKFCWCVNRGLPQYREAGEMVKRYVDKEIKAEELEAAINDHLTPVPPRIRVRSAGGHEDWTTEDGDDRGLDGWKHFVILAWERVPLWRFRVCPVCKVLFYDGSPRGDKTACSKKHKDLNNQRRLRAQQRGTETAAKGGSPSEISL